MKFATVLLGLALGQSAIAMKNDFTRLYPRQSSADDGVPVVPSYNFSMPVDHFDPSNHDTYNNLYFVNDTYYQAGGPVILFDMGESGIDPYTAAQFFAEFNGTTSSAMRLAQKLNGVVIGWEHRYYGASRPVPMDEQAGTPVEGASGYRYLSVEQALEDVAYFANAFNTTGLNLNTVVTSTATLDPYHTPWIIVGGSYPGMRAAWSRLKHPEVFYAAWSSSAPVQARDDGSIYFNPIHRALPTNCTNDIKAVSEFVDSAISSGDATLLTNIQSDLYIAVTPGATYEDMNKSSTWDAVTIGENLAYPITNGYQSFGAAATNQIFCDFMEEFDTESFITANSQSTSQTVEQEIQTILNNTGGAVSTDSGIAASIGDGGSAVAFAAYIYATYYARLALEKFELRVVGYHPTPTQTMDGLSWTWQTLAQLGFVQGSNSSNPLNMLSKYVNITTLRQFGVEAQFQNIATADFPAQANLTEPLSFGGWNMKASNVMFTNGEFDPWRAFGVQSQEVAAGAPQRTLTQDIPKCNVPPSGTDVFGLVYGGGVHVEDMAMYTAFEKGSIDTTNPPLYQGLDLFVNAYNSWLPCFKQSRDDIRNGKGVDGKGDGANGAATSSGSGGHNAASRVGGGWSSRLFVLLGITAVLFAGL